MIEKAKSALREAAPVLLFLGIVAPLLTWLVVAIRIHNAKEISNHSYRYVELHMNDSSEISEYITSAMQDHKIDGWELEHLCSMVALNKKRIADEQEDRAGSLARLKVKHSALKAEQEGIE